MEIRIAQVWQAMCTLGVGLCLVLGLRSSRALAIWGTLTSAAFLAWFVVQGMLLARGRGSRALRVATTVIESTVPWAFLLVLGAIHGPAYALGSWVPPLVFGGLIVGSSARLRPIEPLLIGLSAGVALPLLYFLWLRPALTPAELAMPLYQAQMQISRGFSMAVGGALAMFIARALRNTIGRADIAAREKELFGKYRILRHVASGGMGTVYEALYCPEGGFERPVAIKRIHPHLAREAHFIEFFRNEAELSARLVHPNIVQVLDFGSVDGTYFLAMELVDGLTLQTFLKRVCAARVPVPPRVVALIGREILAGLGYSHGAARAPDGSLLRVIHRDLCPANVLLSKNGEVKISDFGVARALRDTNAAHTRTVAGHAAYMAPEQARALPLDERCDLFALGVILWELCAGQPLFHRGSEGPTLLAVMSAEVPPLASIRADVDRGWDAFFACALAREKEGRFASAADMASALGGIPDARGPGADELRALVAQALALPGPSPSEAGPIAQEVSISTDLPTRVARPG